MSMTPFVIGLLGSTCSVIVTLHQFALRSEIVTYGPPAPPTAPKLIEHDYNKVTSKLIYLHINLYYYLNWFLIIDIKRENGKSAVREKEWLWNGCWNIFSETFVLCNRKYQQDI
jgi:hypothetical protein